MGWVIGSIGWLGVSFYSYSVGDLQVLKITGLLSLPVTYLGKRGKKNKTKTTTSIFFFFFGGGGGGGGGGVVFLFFLFFLFFFFYMIYNILATTKNNRGVPFLSVSLCFSLWSKLQNRG